ncbi:acyl-CoA thioesterase [Blastopirellula retiformator]|uniref:Acyl-CoA thioesterase YbgC n=1 Tax=Blastopirellula retiformator TaxID=2527970 RepID=A0A5C5UVZ6_9BACT|nr:thioesterase family protein [Blastopirellula retiformator]TWT30039.1 acyl-CoA thioesterase YbgC [Blastopirellula retiformator]
MAAIYEHAVSVASADIDMQGHVNNLVYLRWMQDAAVAHSVAENWGKRRYEELGCGWVVRAHSIEYLSPAFEGEEVVIKTWLSEYFTASVLRQYEICRVSDGRTLAKAETKWVLIDMAKRTPRRIPDEILNAFQLFRQDEASV